MDQKGPKFKKVCSNFAPKFSESESESEFETINKLKYMEYDFISFKLWRQVKNTGIYISERGGCVTKNLHTGICYPKCKVKNNKRGHSHYPLYNLPHLHPNNTPLCLNPHRAVALTYLPNYDLFKTQVDHLDGNIFNNHLWNLEWVTPEENIRRATEARKRKEKNNES